MVQRRVGFLLVIQETAHGLAPYLLCRAFICHVFPLNLEASGEPKARRDKRNAMIDSLMDKALRLQGAKARLASRLLGLYRDNGKENGNCYSIIG